MGVTASGITPQREAELEAQPAEPLSLLQVLQIGINLLRQVRYDDAAGVYETILWQIPNQPDALHYLGMIEHKRGRAERALELMRRSVALMPGEAWPWNNYGNVLASLQRHREARDAYQQCIAVAPDHAEAHANLGAVFRRVGAHDQAEAACREAIRLRPDFAVAWYQLSRVLIAQDRIHEALVASSEAIALAPRDSDSRDGVCRALVMLGRREEAAALYREWLDQEPGNAVVRHHLAAIGGDPAPPRAPDDYVRAVFDGFADSFDAKLAKLDYRAPTLVGDHLEAVLAPPSADLDVADLGCGTGLCAARLRPWARRLVGCDLSPGMLAKARHRGGYDELVEGELVAFLAARPASFDLLVSADTFCYFGDLSAASVIAAAALRPAGRFVFTVEATDAPPEAFGSPSEATGAPPQASEVPSEMGDAPSEAGEAPSEAGFVLLPHGRYAHASGFVITALEAAGFAAPRLEARTLRQEEGLPVRGWLVDARLPSASPPRDR